MNKRWYPSALGGWVQGDRSDTALLHLLYCTVALVESDLMAHSFIAAI